MFGWGIVFLLRCITNVLSTMYQVDSETRHKSQETRLSQYQVVSIKYQDLCRLVVQFNDSPLRNSALGVRCSTLFSVSYFVSRTSYLVLSTSYNHFIFEAGLPNTVSFFSTEEMTTDPAPTRAPLPMRTPETMVTPEPINAPSSIMTSVLMMVPAPICT